MFNELSIREAKPLTWLRKGTVVFVGAFLIIGAISTYRAWVQVRNLELRSSDQTLRVGSVIESDVVNSARTTIAVRLELVQGKHTETLDVMSVRGNELGFFDPRSRSATQRVILTKEQLSGFEPGEATLRAIGTGRPQWGRTPPPVVREMKVMISAQ
jgi:hypothetical protein